MLERLRVAVRPRTPWEAADLGLALLRAQAGPVYRAWLAVLLPLALVLAVACRNSPWMAPLIIWWLKPVLDRPVLHVLARGTFGEPPGLLRTLREAPGYCRRGVAAATSVLDPWIRRQNPTPPGCGRAGRLPIGR